MTLADKMIAGKIDLPMAEIQFDRAAVLKARFPKRITMKWLVKFVYTHKIFSSEQVSYMFPEFDGKVIVAMAQNSVYLQRSCGITV